MDMILEEFKKDLEVIIYHDGVFDRGTGKYKKGSVTVEKFRGAMLPLTERDMRIFESGTVGIDDMKLYTERDLKDNSYIIDGTDKYKIYATRKYNIVDQKFKRYFMKRVDEINV